jgi:hypothetical protein
MGLLMAVRLYFIISFNDPIQIITSGDEQASLFSVWKYINGHAVYTDPTRSPYTMSFFNVLFYIAYGEWTGFWLRVLTLPDAWLPMVSRFFTLFGVAVGWIVMFRMLQTVNQKVSAEDNPMFRLLALTCSTVLFVGPLMGFWAFTVRPDLWALVFEILAVFAFIRFYADHKIMSVVLAASLLLVSWYFKQSAVSVIGGIGLFLLFEKEWRLLFIYSALCLSAWAATLYFGSDTYRNSILFTQIQLEYSLTHSAKVWINGLSKTLPVSIPLLVIGYICFRQPAYLNKLVKNWICRFFLIAFFGASAIEFLLTIQNGSAENYLFAPVFLAAGLLICSHTLMSTFLSSSSLFKRSVVFSAGSQALLCLLVLSGGLGVLDAAKRSHPDWINTATCINKLPKPIFAEGSYMSLPWMTESAEPFVLSYTYSRAREIGLAHEKGGIGGRISNGEFATLAISANDPRDTYDGADLRNYTLLNKKCGSLFLWARNKP